MLLCTCICTCISCTRMHTIVYMQTPTGSHNGLENHMHTQTDIISPYKNRVTIKDEN